MMQRAFKLASGNNRIYFQMKVHLRPQIDHR